MCLEKLCNEIAGEYRLSVGETKAFMERTLSSSLSESFGKRAVVLFTGNSLSIYRERSNDDASELEQLSISRLSRKLIRRCRYRIGIELQKRKALAEYDYLKPLQGTLVRGTIERIWDDGSLIVLFSLDELFIRREIRGTCPLSLQPPTERSRYRRCDVRYFFVAKIRLIRLAEWLFKVDVRLSRTSRFLPELLLKSKSGIADIRCIRRVAGKISFVVSKESLPRDAIREVSAELGERVKVTWES